MWLLVHENHIGDGNGVGGIGTQAYMAPKMHGGRDATCGCFEAQIGHLGTTWVESSSLESMPECQVYLEKEESR